MLSGPYLLQNRALEGNALKPTPWTRRLQGNRGLCPESHPLHCLRPGPRGMRGWGWGRGSQEVTASPVCLLTGPPDPSMAAPYNCHSENSSFNLLAQEQHDKKNMV